MPAILLFGSSTGRIGRGSENRKPLRAMVHRDREAGPSNSHRISSSARASSNWGIVRPIAQGATIQPALPSALLKPGPESTRNETCTRSHSRFRSLEEGPYLGTSPELPGLIVQGASPEEVVELAPDIARDLIEVMLENGEALPPGLQPADHPDPRPARRSCVTYGELSRRIRELGCVLKRRGKGSHEIWHNPDRQPLRGDPQSPWRHSTGTLRAILKAARHPA